MDCFKNIHNHTFEIIKTIKGKEIGLGESGLYKVEIKNPTSTNNLNYPKAILISQLDFEEVKIWLNGKYVGSFSTGLTALDYIKIPISNDLLENDSITFVFKTKSSKARGGFSDTFFFLGRTNKLTNIYFHAERVKFTKPLLIAMVFVSFIFVFFLFQFLVRKETLYWYVLLLSCCSLVSVVASGHLSLLFAKGETRLLLLFLSRTLWSYFLFIIFARIAKLEIDKKVQLLGFATTLLIASLISFLIPTGYISSNLGVNIISFVFALGPILSLIICLKQISSFRKNKKKGNFLKIVCMLLGLISSICLYIAISKNYALLPYFDISVLIILTLNSALEFRSNEMTIEKQNSLIINQAQDAAIGDTAKMMAHDLRKPLSQLSSVLENFDEHRMTPGKLAKITEELNYSIEHSENLLATLLDFSRESSLELKEHSLKNIIKESLKLNSRELLRHGVQIVFELDHQGLVLANKERIVRVVSNLISNAIEAQTLMSETPNKHIRFTSKQRNGITSISIINSGPLIPKEDVAQLFEAFYSKGKASGTGLGLASCRKIINLHGQDIWAKNLNKSSEVQITFTLESAEGSDHEALIWQGSNEEGKTTHEEITCYGDGQTKLTIYACNDDLLSNMNLEATFTKTIKQYFPNLTLELHLFDKGEDLLNSLANSHPSLIICDYVMDKSGGKKNGIQVIDEILSKSQQSDCYLLSNWQFESEIDYRLLTPPFKVEHCKKVIEQHLFFLEKRIHS
ncbi:hypothetical protein A9Q84_13545 [Halobacteriovorax marinus]|uniref:histidine kinase n=1 Tax=Halobacteriovorax marinus TaxID=97084 RepID=A0A1Y5F8Y3_9BACT|nr:hypothetical protein A9Q84_13545 [Halobacteriovorax marinus]